MTHSRFSVRALLVSCAPLAAAGILGCSSSDEPPTNTDGQQSSSFCASDENEAPEFSMPMVEMGSGEIYQVAIVEADPPAPGLMNDNVWTVRVTTAAGEPVNDATLTIKCSMPGHGHGCGVQDPDIRNLGDGTYEVDPLIFTMIKNWNVLFTVEGADGKTDFARFSLCI